MFSRLSYGLAGRPTQEICQFAATRSKFAAATRGKKLLSWQRCKPKVGGNRDNRVQRLRFPSSIIGKSNHTLRIYLLQDDPDLGSKYTQICVKQGMGRRLIMENRATYVNAVTRKHYDHLKPSSQGSAVSWAKDWFEENFKIPVIVPHSQPFALYASDIQIALSEGGVFLPLDHIYLKKPITSLGDYQIPVMVPSILDDGAGLTQMMVMTQVMKESTAKQEKAVRKGIDAVDVADDEEYELEGSAVDYVKTLRSTRINVKAQLEMERIQRLNVLRKKKGLPPLSMPDEQQTAST